MSYSVKINTHTPSLLCVYLMSEFVTHEELDIVIKRFESSHEKLCKSYRNHINTKINQSEKNIQWTIKIVGLVLGLALSLVQWYVAVRL